jgi:hypothetical protein
MSVDAKVSNDTIVHLSGSAGSGVISLWRCFHEEEKKWQTR